MERKTWRRLRWACAPVFAALVACSTLEVHNDHDPQADFSKFHTYSWGDPAEKKQAADISGVPSSLVESRIRNAVDAQLAAKGLRRVEPGQPADLVVYDHMTRFEKLEFSGTAFGVGYGYGPWGYYGAPGYDTRQYTMGSLVVDLFDANSKKLVWRGIATDVMEGPEKSGERITQAVSKTFEQYPPPRRVG